MTADDSLGASNASAEAVGLRLVQLLTPAQRARLREHDSRDGPMHMAMASAFRATYGREVFVTPAGATAEEIERDTAVLGVAWDLARREVRRMKRGN